MALFRYTALDSGGARVSGSLAGASEQAVLAELEHRRLTPVSVTQQAARGGLFVRRIGPRELGEAYGQVGDMLHAGVPLLRALRLLGSRKGRPRLAEAFRGLAEQVEKGSDLASAMEAKGEQFEPVQVAMVRAGERGGFLEQVLLRLSELQLKQAELRAKLISNLIYPMLLLLFSILAMVGIFGFLVPMYRPMFDKVKGGLPTVTKVVFAASDAITAHGLLTAGLLVAAGFGVWTLLKRADVRERWERTKTRLPVLGPVVRGYAASRFCHLLGAMLGNGVPMVAALTIARDGAGNVLMSRAIDRAIEEVRAGRALSGPLTESGLFDDDVLEMIGVGEAANNLESVLPKVGAALENRLDRVLTVAIRLIEPMMLLAIAGVIGVVAVALILPMLRLNAGG